MTDTRRNSLSGQNRGCVLGCGWDDDAVEHHGLCLKFLNFLLCRIGPPRNYPPGRRPAAGSVHLGGPERNLRSEWAKARWAAKETNAVQRRCKASWADARKTTGEDWAQAKPASTYLERLARRRAPVSFVYVTACHVLWASGPLAVERGDEGPVDRELGAPL